QYLENDLKTPTNSFAGDQVKAAAEVFGHDASRHAWLAGIEYIDGRIDEALINVGQLVPGLPPPRPPPPVRDKTRRTASVYAQDQIELGDRLAATLGARYDHLSDQ